MKLIIMIETAKKAEEKLKGNWNKEISILIELIKTFNEGKYVGLNGSYYSVN